MPAPQPDQTQQPESVILGRFDGIRNTVKRERMGPRDLVRAINVDLDDDGQLHRRRGFTKVAAGAFSSLFQSNSNVIYGVKDGDLGIVNPDYSFNILRSNVLDTSGSLLDKLVYAQVGPQIYFTSAYSSGIIDTNTSIVGDWGQDQDIWLSPVINPTATLPEIRGKLLGKPPLATSLTLYKGRLYLGQGNLVWATELYLYNYVDKTKAFLPFEGEVFWVGAVSDGIYVGTDEGVYYLNGDTFPLKRIKVMDSAAIPGSLVVVPGELANPPQVGLDADTPVSISLGFMTTTGFCVGSEQGKCVNFTESRVFFPQARAAATGFRRQDGFNQYMVVADHGGDPKNNAAIGDYVDAQIIRGRDKWVQASEGLTFTEQFTPTWS